jgi:hypothetical protein
LGCSVEILGSRSEQLLETGEHRRREVLSRWEAWNRKRKCPKVAGCCKAAGVSTQVPHLVMKVTELAEANMRALQ